MEFLHTPPLWNAFIFTLITLCLTSVTVSLYLHRSLTHRSVEFSPSLCRAFRFWLWFATCIRPTDWIDDHWRSEGYEPDHPSDPGDTEGYHAPYLGVLLLLTLDIAFFGYLGLTVIALQMIWPIALTGIINGRWKHPIGYRNFVTDDASVNMPFLWILSSGESFANNHHADRTSEKFSRRLIELDVGWLLIQILQQLGQVRESRVAPDLSFSERSGPCTVRTVAAVTRYLPSFLALLTRVFEPDYDRHLEMFRQADLALVRHQFTLLEDWFFWSKGWQRDLDDRPEIRTFLHGNARLSAYMELRRRLVEVCHGSSVTYGERAKGLEAWCGRAEAVDGAELLVLVGKVRRAKIGEDG
jgi:stearoyl-CoA desaturase (delta-9 desaturase)